MNNYDFCNSISFKREFRNSEGCFFVDKARKSVIAWHNCSTKLMSFSFDAFEGIKCNGWECPVCGLTANAWKEMAFEFAEPHLYISNINRIIVYSDDSKINIGVYSFTAPEYTQFTVNIKTGHTYRFNRVVLNKKRGIDNKNRNLTNISYLGSDFDLPHDANQYIHALVKSKMKMIHGDNIPDFESYKIGMTLTNLILYVKTPYICPKLYNGILNQGRRNPNDNFNPKKLYVRNDCRNPLDRILSLSGVPNVKSIRKIVLAKPAGYPFLTALSRTFKNVDLIRSLYTAYVDCRNHENHYINFSSAVFQMMVKYRGEQNTASKLLSFINRDKSNNAYTTLSDLISSYDQLENCDFDFSQNYGIDELHHHLALLVTKQGHQNRVISYTQSEWLLEASNKSFSLTLAKDTLELINVGTEMNICVGTYADKAVSKSCTIMVLREREYSVSVGCIELHEGSVVQVKGSRNQLLQNSERAFIKNWAAVKGLTVATNDL